PAVAVGVGEGQRVQADLLADHLDEAGAEHVRRVAALAAVLGHGRPGAAVAVGRVVADGAGVDVRARHHLAGAVGQQQAVELAGVAVDAVALAPLALRQAPAPLVAQPRVHLLQVQRAAALRRLAGVDDADARVLDRQAGQVARRVDGVVHGVAGTFAELGGEAGDAPEEDEGCRQADDTRNEADPLPHGVLHDAGEGRFRRRGVLPPVISRLPLSPGRNRISSNSAARGASGRGGAADFSGRGDGRRWAGRTRTIYRRARARPGLGPAECVAGCSTPTGRAIYSGALQEML